MAGTLPLFGIDFLSTSACQRSLTFDTEHKYRPEKKSAREDAADGQSTFPTEARVWPANLVRVERGVTPAGRQRACSCTRLSGPVSSNALRSRTGRQGIQPRKPNFFLCVRPPSARFLLPSLKKQPSFLLSALPPRSGKLCRKLFDQWHGIRSGSKAVGNLLS